MRKHAHIQTHKWILSWFCYSRNQYQLINCIYLWKVWVCVLIGMTMHSIEIWNINEQLAQISFSYLLKPSRDSLIPKDILDIHGIYHFLKYVKMLLKYPTWLFPTHSDKTLRCSYWLIWLRGQYVSIYDFFFFC